jgi:hypothetical protein
MSSRPRWVRLRRQLDIAANLDRTRRARTRAARFAAALAEKLGVIDRPKVCEWCRKRKPLERHHPCHDRPLDVFWLCHDCHLVADRMDLGTSEAG